MKCGDLGHKTRLGQPCQQEISSHAKGCLWHTRTAAERSILAARGPFVSRMRRSLPETYHVPEFATPETIIQFAHDLAQLALTGDIDKHRLAEARQNANLALAAFAAQDQRRLVEAIISMEHGGAALVLLQRMQERLGDGRRKPLPGRILATGMEPWSALHFNPNHANHVSTVRTALLLAKGPAAEAEAEAKRIFGPQGEEG